MPDALEKEKTPRLGEQPAGLLVDKRVPMPGAGRKDILEGERSDHESGRPVQLEEDDDSTATGATLTSAGEGSRDRKPTEGQTAKR
jgi:hypothetical protein